MPFSSNNGKSYIKHIIEKLNPKTALDIGCGSGTYAKMFPRIKWTGVEIWEQYVEKYNLRNLYQEIHIADARTWEVDKDYDVVFMGDVLEHMQVDEARNLLGKFSKETTIIVSIPIGAYPQDEYEGNPYERHITDNWTVDKFHAEFGQSTDHVVDGDIGVFVYTKGDIAMKIAVYAISKNESHFVKRFCDSAKDADFILIADTGSTDNTVEVAREQIGRAHV